MTRHLCDRLVPHFQVFEILVDGAQLSMSEMSQIFRFLPILLLTDLCITDWSFCDRLGPHQRGVPSFSNLG